MPSVSLKPYRMWNSPGNRLRLMALVLFCVFGILGAAALREMSSTGDETHYLGMGRYLVETHRWDLPDSLLHPPLSYYLQNLMLAREPIDLRAFENPDINARGRALMAAVPDDRLLHLARWPVLLLAVLLGVLVVIWGWQASGPAAGVTALFVYAFSPAILSSAALVTPDLCLTSFSTLTCYFLWRYLRRPSVFAVLPAGIALGLTLLSKYTGILVAIIVVVIAVLQRVLARRSADDAPGRRIKLRHLLLLFLMAAVIVNAGYFFHGALQSFGGMNFRSRLFQKLALTPVLRGLPVPLPQAYVQGVDMQYTVLENGFRYYMLGKVQSRGFLLYYLVAFLAKTPAPLLFLIAILVIFHRKLGREDVLTIVLLLPVVIFFAYFSLTRVSRGIRYVLPVYPLLFLWVSQAAVRLVSKLRRLRPVLMVLGAWYAASCLLVAPHFLAYFNELSGGPKNGQNILDESDFDWGQELKGLGGYLREHGIDRVQLSYFGTADPRHYGISYDPLPCDAAQAIKSGEPIAVSATALHWDCNRWLEGLKPDDRVGYTILLFNLSGNHPSPQRAPK